MLGQLKRLAKRVLSIPLVRGVRRNGTKTVTSTVSKTYGFSVPYHWFAFGNFMREQRSVMAGKAQYYKNLKQDSRSNALLRRNVHRIEKGLIMQPRRPTFAVDYIGETVDVYSKRAARNDSPDVDVNELTWAHNVLTNYFESVEPHPKIDAAKQVFSAAGFTPERDDLKPFLRDPDAAIPSYESMLTLSRQRRSIRWYLDKPVDRDLIDKALLVAREAPSACNRLPYEFRIFDDPKLVEEISSLPFGTTGYSDNIPVIAVLVGKLDSYFSARDRHAIYIDTSLAAMSFSFALETVGLSSCMINWPDFEPLEMKMAKKLGLAKYERPIMLMAIGYADPGALVPRSAKKELATLRSYNRTSK